MNGTEVDSAERTLFQRFKNKLDLRELWKRYRHSKWLWVIIIACALYQLATKVGCAYLIYRAVQ